MSDAITESMFTSKAQDFSDVPLNEYGHVQTRDGKPVRLLANDRKGRSEVIVGAIDEGSYEHIKTWFESGSFFFSGEQYGFDLIRIPKKHTVKGWANLHTDGSGNFHPTKEGALMCRSTLSICVYIDTEGTEEGPQV